MNWSLRFHLSLILTNLVTFIFWTLSSRYESAQPSVPWRHVFYLQHSPTIVFQGETVFIRYSNWPCCSKHSSQMLEMNAALYRTDKRNRNNILTKARNMKKEIVRGSYNRSMSTFPTLLAKRFYGVYFRIFWVSNKAEELSNLPHMGALTKYHLCFLTKSNQSMHNSPYHFLFKPNLPVCF